MKTWGKRVPVRENKLAECEAGEAEWERERERVEWMRPDNKK